MIKKLSYITIFIGIVFGALGLTDAYFSGQIETGENELDAGVLEVNLKDAFGAETAFQLNIGPMEPYQKEANYADKYLSDILQGEISIERTLLYYLTKAKEAENPQDYQNALNDFVKKVKFLKQAGLMSEETKNNLIIKSQIIR